MIMEILKFFFQDIWHWLGGLFYLTIIAWGITNFRFFGGHQ
jgi:hypothetical protein